MAASCASFGVWRNRVVRSPVPAGLWIRSPSAATVGMATLARSLRLTANGSSRRDGDFRLRDHRIERVEGAVQSRERVRRAVERAGEELKGLLERDALARDRAGRRVRLLDQVAQLPRARCQRLHRLRPLYQQPVERGLVAAELGGQIASAGQPRGQVLERLVRLRGLALDARRLALDDAAQARECERIERVEDLVEADERVRVVLADRSAVRDLGRVARGRLEHDVAGGDARQRVLVDPRHGALVQRRRARVDAHRDLRLTVGRQRDRLDRADLARPHQHVIARDEAAGVLEVRVQRVGPAPAEEHEQHHDDRDRQRGDRRDPRDHESFNVRAGIRCRSLAARPNGQAGPLRVGIRAVLAEVIVATLSPLLTARVRSGGAPILSKREANRHRADV